MPLTMQRETGRPAASRGFTLVELLVVVAILVLLAGLIASGASRLFEQQKIRTTQQAMSNMLLAIDNFAKENPLRLKYDSRDGATFGGYPPYMLANRTFPGPVDQLVNLSDLFDRDYASSGTRYSPNEYTLAHRLGRDLGDRNPPNTSPTEWVNLGIGPRAVVNDDNRALAAYMTAYARTSLSLVPERNRAPLLGTPEYVNPRGTGTGDSTNPGRVDRLDLYGFVDGWGVPLDYFLYVKIAFGTTRNAQTGLIETNFRVVDRVPVLRSRGIDRERYDRWLNSNGGNPPPPVSALLDPSRQILSSELPRPYANIADLNTAVQNGQLIRTNQSESMRSTGWLQLVAGASGTVDYQEDAKYRPD